MFQYSSQSKPKVEIADNLQEKETGKLKAELALSTQAEKIKSVERAKSPKTTVSKTKPKVKPKNQPSTPTNIRPTPTREASIPIRTQIVSRPPARIQAPYIPRPRLRPQSLPVRNNPPSAPPVRQFQPVANKVSQPINPKQEEKEINRLEEWTKISRLGSYGSSTIATNTDEQPSLSTVGTIETEKHKPVIPRATLVSAAPYQIAQIPDRNELEPLYSEEAAIIGYQNNYQLTVGASVNGKMITYAIWSRYQNNNSFQKSTNFSFFEKFIIELSKSLNTPDGFVVLPKGSRIVAQINNVHRGGLIELQATQLLMNGQEYILPPNSITIRGDGGKPLVASRLNSKKGEIARRDAQTFAVGSLAKVGKVLNQPKEQQISTRSGLGGTNSFSSIRRNRENILGAVLEGGFEPLTQEIIKRNQQALQKIQQQENVWYVKAGTNVQVFVNQSFQF